MPGVQVLRSSGEPGSETSGIRVRGFSSANSTSTLVLIDGVEGDMTLLNPNDIESISVPKDAAAAAIYGARAAAGVVLVTTKSGANSGGKATVTYNGYYAFNVPTVLPERLPTWEEQEMINISRFNQGTSTTARTRTAAGTCSAPRTGSWTVPSGLRPSSSIPSPSAAAATR